MCAALLPGSFDIKTQDPKGGVIRAVSSECILPEGKWTGIGSGRTWDRETEPLKEGMKVQFRNFSILNRDEFQRAVETSLPGAKPAEIEIVLNLFDADDNGSITIKEFSDRMLQLSKERDEGISIVKVVSANNSPKKKGSLYLAKKREEKQRRFALKSSSR